MVRTFDRIRIGVPDLAAAIAQYQQLMDATPWVFADAAGIPSAWVGLSNTVIELVEQRECPAGIMGIVFRADGCTAPAAAVANPRRLDLARCDGSATAEFRRNCPQAQAPGLHVDHLVLHTADASECIELFATRLGIRLALDKTVPRWGGRMVFLRAGKLTLEIIEPIRERPQRDFFWGIAYQCQDIDQAALQLDRRGVMLSAIREGRKPGTRVATLKSHCLDIPTLLLESAG